jgi:hypothetical protein
MLSEKATLSVKSYLSVNNVNVFAGEVSWRIRTTSSSGNMKVEFYNPTTSQWYLLTWRGGSSKGAKTNVKLVVSSAEGGE